MINNNSQQMFEKIAKDGTWQANYDSTTYITYNFIARREAVRRMLKKDTFSSALDLGCGAGDYFEILSSVSNRYFGIDFSPNMIRQTRLNYINFPSQPICIVGDGEKLPFIDDSFDLICAIGFIEYFRDPNIVIREIARVLKPGGTLIMQSYQVDFYNKILKMFGLDLMKRAIKYVYRKFWRSTGIGSVINKSYGERQLDQLMIRFGFYKICCDYNNFNVFPKTIRRLFPNAYIGCSEKITKWNSNIFSVFAVNYIGRYVIDKNDMIIAEKGGKPNLGKKDC